MNRLTIMSDDDSSDDFDFRKPKPKSIFDTDSDDSDYLQKSNPFLTKNKYYIFDDDDDHDFDIIGEKSKKEQVKPQVQTKITTREIDKTPANLFSKLDNTSSSTGAKAGALADLILRDSTPPEPSPILNSNSVRRSSFTVNNVDSTPILRSAAETIIKANVSPETSSIRQINNILPNTLLRSRDENQNRANSILKAKETMQMVDNKFMLENKPTYKDTIDRILMEKPFWFDLYKTKSDKLSLLNEAINSSDGNAILAVILFLKRSLNEEVFHDILLSETRNIALNQYIVYLEQMNETESLEALYKHQGAFGEAANVSYLRSILASNNAEIDLKNKEKLLYECEKKYENYMTSLNQTSYLLAVKKQLKLLWIQNQLRRNDVNFLKKNKILQQSIEATKNGTLFDTVSFCMKYSRDLIDNESYSIDNLKKSFDLTNKEYAIWYVKSLADISCWTEMEKFINQKGILNMIKNPALPYDIIVNVLADAKAPSEQIKKYLSQVENIEKRQTLAIKLDQPDLAIQTFKAQKDRIGLIRYRERFKDGSIEYMKCTKILLEEKRWKN